MAFEGPFLTALIARLAEPKFNLAAHGVAYAFAILIEAPVIMMMSASTALVESASSYRKLRNFTWALNAAITGVMVLLLLPPVFHLIARDWIGLPTEVARLTHTALLILLPWPAAIGYRRFLQGLLIANGLTRRVAYGTLVRLFFMSATAYLLYFQTGVSGAYVGAAALCAGVCAEAIAVYWMARATVRQLAARSDEPSPAAQLSYRRIAHFYYPLALTSVLSLAVHPVVTFFMGRAPYSLESLAVLPVVNALTFIFRALAMSYQEVAIALVGRDLEYFNQVGRFGFGLAICTAVGLGCIGFTPLSGVWFERISGLSPDLAAFAVTPARIMAPFPALALLVSLQRAVLVKRRNTGPITGASMLEVGAIVVILFALIRGTTWAGATAAAVAFILGRLAGNLFLLPSFLGGLKPRVSVGAAPGALTPQPDIDGA